MIVKEDGVFEYLESCVFTVLAGRQLMMKIFMA